MLILDAAIDVPSDPRQSVSLDSFHNVRKIQLAGELRSGVLALSDHHSVVRGKLFEKQSGEDYADVLMEVMKIQEIDGVIE